MLVFHLTTYICLVLTPGKEVLPDPTSQAVLHPSCSWLALQAFNGQTPGEYSHQRKKKLRFNLTLLSLLLLCQSWISAWQRRAFIQVFQATIHINTILALFPDKSEGEKKKMHKETTTGSTCSIFLLNELNQFFSYLHTCFHTSPHRQISSYIDFFPP